MKRFKNILVVINSKVDNGALFYQALDLAQKNNAAITVIDVIEELSSRDAERKVQESVNLQQEFSTPIIEKLPQKSSPSSETEGLIDDWEKTADKTEHPAINIQEIIFQEEKDSLQKFLTALQEAGIQVQSEILYGVPFIKIIQKVLKDHHDLVMITADGSGVIKQTLFGSTTMHLMRKCPCPVWVIKPGQPRRFKRILAAVDLVKDDAQREALANKIMQMSTSLARTNQSELQILHTWSMFGESVLRGRGGISNEVINNLLQETRNVHLQWIQDLLQQHPLDGIQSEIYLLKGDAGEMITELSQSKDVDLIIMGTVSRTGLSGFLIGNTAENVLQQVNCSILAVKPEGFISPVKVESK
jgi:nucleotide-binding universal stress UspA family protein